MQLTNPHQKDLICIILFQKNYTDVELENEAHNTHTECMKWKKKKKRFDIAGNAFVHFQEEQTDQKPNLRIK